MGSSALTHPLLEYLAYISGSKYLSDLHYLDGTGRNRIAQALENISSESVSLWEWNDALKYLVEAGPAASPSAARELLIEQMRG